jgi:hypothetical protein
MSFIFCMKLPNVFTNDIKRGIFYDFGKSYHILHDDMIGVMGKCITLRMGWLDWLQFFYLLPISQVVLSSACIKSSFLLVTDLSQLCLTPLHYFSTPKHGCADHKFLVDRCIVYFLCIINGTASSWNVTGDWYPLQLISTLYWHAPTPFMVGAISVEGVSLVVSYGRGVHTKIYLL